MEESVTLTSRLRKYLETTPVEVVDARDSLQDDTTSVVQKARDLGLTLAEYVERDPIRAVLAAEGSLAAWQRVLETALMNGFIAGANGPVRLTKITSDMLISRIEDARNDLRAVQAIADMTGPENKGDVLLKSLYIRAVREKDTRALTYLIDRLDGRIAEGKSPTVDYDNAYNVYQIVHTLFDKQLEVLNSGPGTKIVMCSRRSGKTLLAAAACLITCLSEENVQCIYIGETMKLSEQLMDSAMRTIIQKCDLKDSGGNPLNWRSFENGSNIMVRGLSSTKDPDAIRGNKAKLIIIDEFFHLKDELLEYLQAEVLEPMQLDYAKDHKQIFIGTPAKIKGTFGDKMWDTLDAPHFHWYAKDNPYITDFDEFVAQKCIEKGLLTEDGLPNLYHPYIQREYFGVRAYDTDALFYPEYHTFSRDDVLPQYNIDLVVIGLDYGVSDNDAVIGIAWDTALRRGYVFFEAKFNRLTVDKSETMLTRLKREVKMCWQVAMDFFPSLGAEEANKRILWEADSTDQQLTQELMYNVRLDNSTVKLRITNAHKTDKILMEDKLRDLLRTGALLLPEGGKTAEECIKTVLKRDPQGNLTLDIDDHTYHPDLLPAMRYAMWDVVGMEVLSDTMNEREHAV
jgi:hypothetical protein